MCILCVVQKWSRKVATMLPWLVIPLVGLWALSQLLPPAFRFEITSPRLACVLVLLVTLFWYEVLMPQLSAWRSRRNARLRERKRFEAIIMHKLRKTATRRCRNCLSPYQDQNPGGGKFMCSYCGHLSKRPVLDLPVSSDMSNSGVLKDLVGKGGKTLNGKAWDNGGICGQDWLDNGNWSGGDDHCLAEESYSSLFISACKSLTAFFFSVLRLWRKVFMISSSRADASADLDRQRMLDKQSQKGGNGQECRGEKARRKAEEKRQARLEKELFEEEERKQREEVARLVEERRRLLNEKMEAELEYRKESPRSKEKDTKKEPERKRRERKKEKDMGSSKSNSDVEELEKKVGKVSDRNKKSDDDRQEQHRNTHDIIKAHGTEVGNGVKNMSSNHNRGNAGTRYFDCVKGTLLSSSRAFSGGGFFGKNTSTSTLLKQHRPTQFVDHTQSPAYKKETVQTTPISTRSVVNGDHKSITSSVLTELPQRPAPKKSWQQLFTRSTAVCPPANSSVISRPTEEHQAEDHSPALQSRSDSTQSFDNPISFGLPFTLSSFPIVSNSSTAHLPSSSEAMSPNIRDAPDQFLPEESEIFEDPYYVPNPVSLLGPVSESLDDFQLDLGLATEKGSEKLHALKASEKLHALKASEVTKPSPIEPPLSRFKVSEENHAGSSLFPGTVRAMDNSSITENRTWQMWNSSPLGQDALGLVGGPLNWNLPPEMNVTNREDSLHSLPYKTMASLFKKDMNTAPVAHSQPALFGNSHNGGTFNTLPCNADGMWPPNTFPGSISSNENKVALQLNDEASQNGSIYRNLTGSAINPRFELPTTNSWVKNDRSVAGARDDIEDSVVNSPHVGGQYTRYDWKEAKEKLGK